MCLRNYTRDELHAELGWEPVRRGWRCGSCSRTRRHAAQEYARALIERTVPKWSLALVAPAHGVYDECFECEALALAATTLLQHGNLTSAEADALTAAVIARPGRPTKRCAKP